MGLEILNKYFDKVFVITLEHELDAEKFVSVGNLKPTANNRISRIKERLSGLEYEFFYGVDGSKCEFGHVETTADGTKIVKPQNLTFGQIGCSLSHVKLYEIISNSDWERVLILEDDCVFNSDINNFDNYFSQLPDNWGMIYLGWVGHLQTGNISPNIFKISQQSFVYLHCTHAIGLTKEFAKKMAEFNKECFYTADGAYTAIVRNNNEVCYAIIPNLATQENIDCTSYEIDLKYKNI
jgi:GR25 family glycosyltransferase involved in LPS biosynthesis